MPLYDTEYETFGLSRRQKTLCGVAFLSRQRSVDQIERFYARNLPLSREMAINLQSFGSGED